MKKISLLMLCFVFGTFAFGQEIVSAWTFDGLTGTNSGASGTEKVIPANSEWGAGTFYADGTNGSDNLSNEASPEINAFNGTTMNDPRTTADASKAIAIANSSANGKSVVFKFSMTGFQNLELSYAQRGTASGFSTETWSYSTNGTDFTVVETISGTNQTNSDFIMRNVYFSTTDLNDAAEVYIKLTVDGATNASGNNRIDNVVFRANLAGPDVYAPHITNVSVTSANTVTVTFNEDLDNTTATVLTNYSFDNGCVTSNASVSGNVVNVAVTPDFANGVAFNMFVQNVTDVAGNVMAPDTFALMYGIPDEFMCADIATLRSKLDYTGYSANVQDTVEYKLTGSVIVTATAAYNNQKVLQDETGAILVYDQSNVLGSLEVGDEISGVYCKLTNYFGFLELVPTRPYEQLVGYFQTVDPQVITLSQLNDNDFMIQRQAELIELDNVTITSSGNFAKLNRYDLLQNGVTAPALYPYFQDADYLTLPIPTGVEQNITGINFATSKIGSSNFDFRYYIVPRFITDMTGMNGVQDYGKMQIAVYPNPTTAFVTVNDIEATDVEIYDINGKKVASQSMQNTNIVSMQGLSAGSYFLRLLKDNELVGTAKVIKR